MEWLSEPLGNEIERILGETEHDSLCARAVFNWQRWLSILEESERATQFASTLTIAQLNAHKLLREAWTGRPQDREALLKTINIFEDAATNNQEIGLPKPGDPEYRLPIVPLQSFYHASISNLFMWEFFCSAEEQDEALSLSVLHDVRGEAALFAACQRRALLLREPARIMPSNRDTCESLDESSPRNPGSLHSSWKRESCIPGATIEPCPWLGVKENVSELPYYLWDTERYQTRIVDQLTEAPNYIAISHTWGRWRIKDSAVGVEGVPWNVPQNTRFRVEDIGTILRSVPQRPRYVWFDLVCIPQDGSERARIEISHQASIFRGASTAIVWFNDIDVWTSLEASIQWLCASFLQFNESEQPESDFGLGNIDNLAASSIELFKANATSTVPGRDSGLVLNPWMTSLWTLQELCLRPDILMCNSHWKLLSFGHDVPITFDELVALEQANAKALGSTLAASPKPRGAMEISAMLRSTGTADLLQMSRPTILILGDKRHCSERRAEAVMAVLDATDWYSTTNDAANEANLVMGKYPLGFLHDVCYELGSATFFSTDSMEPYFHRMLTALDRSNEVEAVGSLLPFGSAYPKIYRELRSNPVFSAHPSVSTWIVEATGTVRICEAVIVASANSTTSEKMPSVIFGPVLGGQIGEIMPQENVDLHYWVSHYEPSFCNYAVCLFSAPKATVGILLKELAPGFLVKVGSYLENARNERETPIARSVNWLVL